MAKGKKQRVLVGLSGGVDSAVSAHLLLKAGYEVEGVFMKNWSSTTGLKLAECPWLADRQEALRVAAFLGIPLHTVDFEKQYQQRVMSYFFKEYQAGRTPNPDVMCNKEIKFKLLYDWARKQGFEYLATGHYARVKKSVSRNQKSERLLKTLSAVIPSEAGSAAESRNLARKRSFVAQSLAPQDDRKGWVLERSSDEFKDQTYFIYNIRTEQLPHVLFPIGGMKKTEVKKLAKKIGLPNAARKESMGLCFVGKVRLKEFLEQKVRPKPGPIVLVKDKGLRIKDVVLGTHQGLYTYTIGQRQGIQVGGPGGPYYVVGKDLKSNTLYVTNNANDPLLEAKEVVIHSVNWITAPNLPYIRGGTGRDGLVSYSPPTQESPQYLGGARGGMQLTARYRHQGDLVPCVLEQLSKDQYKIKFKTPQKALASGQSVVLYSGRVCLGGGVIV